MNFPIQISYKYSPNILEIFSIYLLFFEILSNIEYIIHCVLVIDLNRIGNSSQQIP